MAMAVKFSEMTDKELDKQLENSRNELRELRFSFAVSRSLQNPARPGQLKKNVARILTLKRQREIAATKEGIKK